MAAQQRMLGTIIEAMPDPILVVDRARPWCRPMPRPGAASMLPSPPVPLARVLRDPGVLAAVSGALTGTAASAVSFSPTHDRAKQFNASIEPVDLGEDGAAC